MQLLSDSFTVPPAYIPHSFDTKIRSRDLILSGVWGCRYKKNTFQNTLGFRVWGLGP